MRNYQFEQLLKDEEILDELKERAHRGDLKRAAEIGISGEQVEMAVMPEPPVPAENTALEAIVLEFGRPSLIIHNGTFEVPESSTWRRILLTQRHMIEEAIVSVGRIELMNHLTYDWIGTGWVVAPSLIITNRHVAEVFATSDGSGSYSFTSNPLNQLIGVRVDFLEEHEREEAIEIAVERIVYVAPGGSAHPDIALLQVAADAALPSPLPLSTRRLEPDDMVGIIGYPAFDTRNGLDAMRRYFGEIYDVKRFAPGKVRTYEDGSHFFLSDYTSLGGNSGSAVIDLFTGAVVGIHFAGRFREANFAVKAKEIEELLTSLSISVGPSPETDRPTEEESPEADKTHPPEHYAGRDGYWPDFLGPQETTRVPLPGFGRWSDDLVDVAGASQENRGVARYRHFSVVMTRSRRLPLIAAANIDGRSLRRIPRVRKWYLDGRIAAEHQTGNELYKNNDLDRGHMVRRLDPVWGDLEGAREANDDTFHYTNAAPQHRLLNQRDWVDLESIILDHADARDSKLSVLTGPVLRDNDPAYRDVALPREFWKVVALVDEDTESLAVLCFVLTHSHLIRNLEETILDPGSLRVFQVPIGEIEETTGLDFSVIAGADVLAGGIEGEEGVSYRCEIREFDDIVYGP